MKILEKTSKRLVIHQDLSSLPYEPIEVMSMLLLGMTAFIIPIYQELPIFLALFPTIFLFIYILRQRFRTIDCVFDKNLNSIAIKTKGPFLLEAQAKDYPLRDVKLVKTLIMRKPIPKYYIQLITFWETKITLNAHGCVSAENVKDISSSICNFLDISHCEETR